MKITIGLTGLITLLSVLPVDARVTRIEVTRREPFAAAQPFGTAGAYEKVVGRFHGELDPGHALNRGIVDLDRAPRNARGAVEYSADFYVLKPVDLGRGNGALFYDVNNRGRKFALFQLNSAPRRVDDPSTAEDAGNGFLMRHGFTVVWSGWSPGLPAANHILRLDVPVAGGAGTDIEGRVWDDFQFNTATETVAKLTFRAASTDPAAATLFVRDRGGDPRVPVAAGGWEFVDAQSIRLLPAGTPFRMGAIYELVYRTSRPVVAGIGFAATRDFIAFLRYAKADDTGTPNPLAGLRRALAHGTSQSGRYLRDFVYRGFNEDEAGRIVFDGINPHVATARMFLNQRFAQPNRGATRYPDVTFPFAYETQTDPFTGAGDGLLVRCAARGNCPKVIHTVSSTEYWNSAHSTVTTDPLGRRDGTPPDNVRIYLVAGTQHVAGQANPRNLCALPHNPTDLRPALRALTVALDRWVMDGTAPPPSRYPRVGDGSLVSMETFGFPAIPGVPLPRGPGARPRYDLGPAFANGIVDRVPPEALADRYGVLVPKVDADGNEVGGIRLPDIAVPVATATGWVLRAPTAGAAGDLCPLDGALIPFARTKTEREAKGDPRPSLEERYRDRTEYMTRVLVSALDLQRSGYLLAEDVERILEQAARLPW